MGRPLAVFDLDGVLADVAHRVRFLEQRPKDWDAFFRAAVDDPVLAQGAQLVREAAKDCEVVYLTGRPERCRRDTLRWLAANDLPAGTLLMRQDRDRRPARRLKPRVLAQLAAGRQVAVVVDDDHEVCDAYEQARFTVLRAAWAQQSTALHQAQEGEGKT